MSKVRSKKISQPRDVTPYWQERGYCADIANRAPQPNQDPQGEEAYQQAFAEAAKKDPPRLPNPSSYPNSSSAKEYLQRQDQEWLSPRIAKRESKETLPAQAQLQVFKRSRDPDQAPTTGPRSSTSTSPASVYSQNSTTPFAPQYSVSSVPRPDSLDARGYRINQEPPYDQKFAFKPQLAVLEPMLGALQGPKNPFR